MKYSLLLAIYFLPAFSYGQSKKFSFNLGSDYNLSKRSYDLSFFGNEKDGIVNLSLTGNKMYITRFEPNTLSPAVEKMIEIPGLGKNFNKETVVNFDTNYFWVFSDWNKKEEREYLYYDKIDVVSGKIMSSNNKMIETTKMGLSFEMTEYGYPSIQSSSKYKFYYSADTKKLLVSYTLFPINRDDRKNHEITGLNVFDENMNKLWGNEFTMPYTEAIMDNIDFSIDTHGNVYMLAKVYDSEKRKERDKETGKAGYHYEVLKFTKDNNKITNTIITADDYFIRQVAFIENSLNETVISCTYSKKAKGEATDGIFLNVVGPDGVISKYKKGYYEFPLAELEKFESARSKRKMEQKNDDEASNLTVRNLVVETDGSVLIAFEEYYEFRGSPTTYEVIYFYGDIIVARINPAGNFEWIRNIPKNQMGRIDRRTMSFKLVYDATGYYFLYLDNLKNMNLKDDDVPKLHIDGFGGQLVIAKIDKSGVITKELAFDTRDEDILLFPALFKKINTNQFIGRATFKKNLFRPLLITIK
jgi:hypothetical protein